MQGGVVLTSDVQSPDRSPLHARWVSDVFTQHSILMHTVIELGVLKLNVCNLDKPFSKYLKMGFINVNISRSLEHLQLIRS